MTSTAAVGRGLKKAGKAISKAARKRKERLERDRLLSQKSRHRQLSIEQLRNRSNELRPIERFGRVDHGLVAAFAGQGFDFAAARAWNEGRFTPDEAAGWTGKGFSLQQAQKWRSLNFTRMEATAWRDKGFSASAAKRKKDGDDPKVTRAFGGSLEVAKSFHRRGFTFEEAVAWCKSDVPAQTAAVLRANGVRLTDMAA